MDGREARQPCRERREEGGVGCYRAGGRGDGALRGLEGERGGAPAARVHMPRAAHAHQRARPATSLPSSVPNAQRARTAAA